MNSGESMKITEFGTITVKAIAEKDGLAQSSVVTTSFNVLPKVETPVITPSLNTFVISAMLQISDQTDGATIYYTTDGSDPTRHSLTINPANPLIITKIGQHTIKSFARKANMLDSDIASKVLTILDRLVPPKLTPISGAYIGDVLVKARCADASSDDTQNDYDYEGGKVHYTTDDTSTPTILSPYVIVRG